MILKLSEQSLIFIKKIAVDVLPARLLPTDKQDEILCYQEITSFETFAPFIVYAPINSVSKLNYCIFTNNDTPLQNDNLLGFDC